MNEFADQGTPLGQRHSDPIVFAGRGRKVEAVIHGLQDSRPVEGARSLGRIMPGQQPVTYIQMTLSQPDRGLCPIFPLDILFESR